MSEMNHVRVIIPDIYTEDGINQLVIILTEIYKVSQKFPISLSFYLHIVFVLLINVFFGVGI